jgi:hypothetical protein
MTWLACANQNKQGVSFKAYLTMKKLNQELATYHHIGDVCVHEAPMATETQPVLQNETQYFQNIWWQDSTYDVTGTIRVTASFVLTYMLKWGVEPCTWALFTGNSNSGLLQPRPVILQRWSKVFQSITS